MQRGNQLLAGRHYEQALTAFLAHAREVPKESCDAYASAAKACEHINCLDSPQEIEPGVRLVFEGSRETAEVLLRKALAINSGHYESLVRLSEVLPDRSSERLELMERAVAIQPRYLTLLDIGDHYRTVNKDFNRAYDYYIAANERSPRDQDAYRRLIDICKRLDRLEESQSWKNRWQEVKNNKRRVGRKS